MMQWNRGAFMGSAIGAMAWMIVPALMGLGLPSIVAGIGVGVCPVTAAVLWRRRDEISAHTGLQVQILVSALASLAVVIVFDVAGQLPSLDPRVPRMGFYAMLLIFPVLSLVFWFRERSAAVSTQP
jgi:hypothetical protein